MQFSHRLKAYCILAGLVIALAACQSDQATPPGSFDITVIAPTPGSGYPAPEAGETSGYPAPEQAPSTPEAGTLPEVTPDAALGQVSGILLRQGTSGAQAVQNQLLYLAEILKDTEGNERAASLDRQKSPRAITDAEGAFQFINVQPGRYGLVLDTIIESYLLNDPDSGESLIISVDAGGNIDLGSLSYEDLPLPPE